MLLAAMLAGVIACGESDPARSGGAEAASPMPGSTSVVAGGGVADGAAAPDPTTATRGFDPESVPVSAVALGEFPYIALPEGYRSQSARDRVIDFARVPLWLGDRVEWVEGRVYQSAFFADAGKQFSSLELVRNLDHVIRQAGGAKAFDGMVPTEARNAIPPDVLQAFNEGLGAFDGYPVHVWLVRRADRHVWVYLSAHTAGGGWMVVESTPFEATAALLPAAALQSDLDASGRVAVEINFDTDSATILPASDPQLAQIEALLRADDGLRLSIEGHTDGTGDPASNQRLSERRAAAVVSDLVARGIAGERLVSAGFGATRPVAGNDDEEGKRRNRRVELAKR